MYPRLCLVVAVCCAASALLVPLAVAETQVITLSNAKGMKADILSLGAIVQRLIVPDKDGKPVDVALGMATPQEYLALDPNPYLGAVIGRVSNRIVGSQFELDGKTYNTTVNDVIPEPGTNSTTPTVNDTIHGGKVGFTHREWSARKAYTLNSEMAILNLKSADGDQGFPGNLDTWVIYELFNDTNRMQITFLASTDKPTPVSLTTHAYFNLNGHASNTTIEDHVVTITSNYYTPTYSNAIVPTGEIASVNGTAFDLRKPTVIGSIIDRVPGPDVPHGYDINYATPVGYPNAPNITDPAPRPVLIATVVAPKTGILMDVYTNGPGFEWYTGNHLPGPTETPIQGKDGAIYKRRDGFAIEPQGWPTALVHPQFPSIIVRPGQIYEQQLVWDFSVTK